MIWIFGSVIWVLLCVIAYFLGKRVTKPKEHWVYYILVGLWLLGAIATCVAVVCFLIYCAGWIAISCLGWER